MKEENKILLAEVAGMASGAFPTDYVELGRMVWKAFEIGKTIGEGLCFPVTVEQLEKVG